MPRKYKSADDLLFQDFANLSLGERSQGAARHLVSKNTVRSYGGNLNDYKVDQNNPVRCWWYPPGALPVIETLLDDASSNRLCPAAYETIGITSQELDIIDNQVANKFRSTFRWDPDAIFTYSIPVVKTFTRDSKTNWICESDTAMTFQVENIDGRGQLTHLQSPKGVPRPPPRSASRSTSQPPLWAMSQSEQRSSSRSRRSSSRRRSRSRPRN